jgi:hypothetical protein
LPPTCTTLGVDDLTIQRILRHSDVSVTRRGYVKRLPRQAVKGMAVFQANVAAVEKKAKAAAASAGSSVRGCSSRDGRRQALVHRPGQRT